MNLIAIIALMSVFSGIVLMWAMLAAKRARYYTDYLQRKKSKKDFPNA